MYGDPDAAPRRPRCSDRLVERLQADLESVQRQLVGVRGSYSQAEARALELERDRDGLARSPPSCTRARRARPARRRGRLLQGLAQATLRRGPARAQRAPRARAPRAISTEATGTSSSDAHAAGPPAGGRLTACAGSRPRPSTAAAAARSPRRRAAWPAPLPARRGGWPASRASCARPFVERAAWYEFVMSRPRPGGALGQGQRSPEATRPPISVGRGRENAPPGRRRTALSQIREHGPRATADEQPRPAPAPPRRSRRRARSSRLLPSSPVDQARRSLEHL